jgi:hypothetical protein
MKASDVPKGITKTPRLQSVLQIRIKFICARSTAHNESSPTTCNNIKRHTLFSFRRFQFSNVTNNAITSNVQFLGSLTFRPCGKLDGSAQLLRVNLQHGDISSFFLQSLLLFSTGDEWQCASFISDSPLLCFIQSKVTLFQTLPLQTLKVKFYVKYKQFTEVPLNGISPIFRM